MIEIDRIYNENCLDTMAKMDEGSIDLVVTSPPYDNLRKYNGFSFDIDGVIGGLHKVVKPGGVVVWVVGDETVDGCESCTSFQQAIKFVQAGFSLHDTMIYQKECPTWNESCKRYRQTFEYMFVFSKGRPGTFNPIRDVKVKNMQPRKVKSNRTGNARYEMCVPKYEYTVRGNIWRYNAGSSSATDQYAFGHPAIFPEKLAEDHILTWSNPDDLVYDPFMGSGTTAKMAIANGRHWIGSEISGDYCRIIENRLGSVQVNLF